MMNLDTMDPVQSMTNGLYYDSKSALRCDYKRAGAIEGGNDVQTKPTGPTQAEKKQAKDARRASIGRALSRAGIGAP